MNEIPLDKIILESYPKDITRFKQFLRYIESQNYTSITKQNIVEFIERMRAMKYANATMREWKRVIKKAVFQTLDENSVDYNCYHSWERVLNKIVIRKSYNYVSFGSLPTDDEINKLLTEIKVDWHRLIIMFAYSLGCRTFELCNLKKDDVSRHDNYDLFKIEGKGGKFRDVPADHSLMDTYEKLYDSSKTINYLFESSQNPGKPYSTRQIQRILRDSSLRVCGRVFTFYKYRHRFGTKWYAASGGNTIEGSRVMGNSPRVNLEFYCHSPNANMQIAELFKIDKLLENVA